LVRIAFVKERLNVDIKAAIKRAVTDVLTRSVSLLPAHI